MGKLNTYKERLEYLYNMIETGKFDWETACFDLELNINPDSLRKAFKTTEFSGYEVMKYFKENNLITNTEDELKRIEKARFELLKDRKKTQTLMSYVHETARKEGRADLLREEIVSAINNLKPIEIKEYNVTKRTEQIGLLNLADVHYGKEVCLKTFDGEIVNEYSPEIFEKRMWRLLNTMLADSFDYKKLVIFGLGDYIEGLHRVSTLSKLKYGMTESVIKFSEFMAVWLNKLQQDFGIEVEFQMVSGNHDEVRLITNKAGDFPEEDATKLIYEFLELRLKDNKNIKVKLCNGICFYSFYGVNVIGDHGIGDVEKNMKHYENFHNISCDIYVSGHLHHKEEKTMGYSNYLGEKQCIRVNSLIGVCDYSHKIKAMARAGTKFILFSEDGVELEKTYYLN